MNEKTALAWFNRGSLRGRYALLSCSSKTEGKDLMRSTHTFATLKVSRGAYNEIAELLRAANYDHAFIDDAIDMHGIALISDLKPDEHYSDCPVSLWGAVRGESGAPECTCDNR